MDLTKVTHIDNVRLSDDEKKVRIIDQTLLPNKTEYLELEKLEDLYEAILKLRVRGAPAIGIFAGYAMYVLSLQSKSESFDDFYKEFTKNKEYLDSSRPTAVNLGTMLKRMDRCVLANKDKSRNDLLEALKEEAKAIHKEDMEMCYKISEYGLSLVEDGFGILTHCNAGPLATSRYGTGLGTIMLGTERGMKFHAFVDETRPLLQGARLTSYELEMAGVDTTLICDNMASIVMKQGKVQACFVGCDRVAANGDVANKIGTSGVAILAKHYGIPFYVFCPSSTIDFDCPSGDNIEIELRDPEEIKEMFYTEPKALPQTKCYNPAFDVTDNELVTAIITEKGICRAPYNESLAKLFK
ncbi:MAG: S-methyl-5-thioribose-1-phosphate isomerase [Lachnospiraceae bacterium]|nr:S-methyl-5-thioribose-1-phosphate isomerase [Lachnospiraceae bacterium]